MAREVGNSWARPTRTRVLKTRMMKMVEDEKLNLPLFVIWKTKT
jgi:hypothetical protein